MAERKRRGVIYDMDGTLVDVSGIRHFVIPSRENNWRKDFDAFHDAAVDCPPIPWVVKSAWWHYNLGLDVIISTARKTQWRHHSAWWLAMWAPPTVSMFMRHRNDNRKDFLVKEDYAQVIEQRWDIVVAYDDNPSILPVWQRRGWDTVRVPGWED